MFRFICGLLMIAIVLFVLVILGWNFFKRDPRGRRILGKLAGYGGDINDTPILITKDEALPTDRMSEKSIAEKLPYLTGKQTVMFTGGKSLPVIGGFTLIELEQKYGSKAWTPRGGKSVGVFLAGDVWLMRIPDTEGGPARWFRFTKKRAMGLSEFFKGGDTEKTYGPARTFARVYKQQKPVPFELPNELPSDPNKITWQVVDVGAFKVEVNPGTPNTEPAQNGDLQMFVSADEKNGPRRLLFLDPRQEPGYQTRGRGGLFIGEPFDPDVDITDIL